MQLINNGYEKSRNIFVWNSMYYKFYSFAKVDRISKLLDGHTYLSPYSIF